jgi:light-regulated signal transduction histidine kinase (bacteriophytochrome)
VRFGFYLIITITFSRLKTGYEERATLVQKLEDTVERLNQYKDELEAKAGELIRSNQELEHFASAAAHDLREPLIVIGGYTRQVNKKYKDVFDADTKELINTIMEGVSRMEKMISGLLSYARVETKGREFTWISGDKVLDGAIDGIRHSIEESGAVVTRDAFPDLMADEVQLSQVFQNLIANAIKFRVKEVPEIHVSAKLNNDEWVFAVRDNSIGIAPEHLETIFGIFKRVHSKTDYPGCGIGLALCKKIVERHGGRIWVESDTGNGSVFYFTIPAAKQPEITD